MVTGGSSLKITTWWQRRPFAVGNNSVFCSSFASETEPFWTFWSKNKMTSSSFRRLIPLDSFGSCACSSLLAPAVSQPLPLLPFRCRCCCVTVSMTRSRKTKNRRLPDDDNVSVVVVSMEDSHSSTRGEFTAESSATGCSSCCCCC